MAQDTSRHHGSAEALSEALESEPLVSRELEIAEAAVPAVKLRTPPRVVGKFLEVDGERFFFRGVTYGTFRPNADGDLFPPPEVVDRDFALMRQNGVNSLRTYTAPPGWFLDLAAKHGLYVLVGLCWNQLVAFLESPKDKATVVREVRRQVRALDRHPAILCYAIGNEVPAKFVRWYGARKVERFLEELFLAVKAEHPEALVTYVNYPTTEYLRLPFLDFHCFNVYLEDRKKFAAYLARLQNLAGEKPLLLAEIGLDSQRKGELTQARTLEWLLETVYSAGAVGTFVFAWTDEWHCNGFDIEDWKFGLVDKQRKVKPALHSVRRTFAQVPVPKDKVWPKVSVVVCTFNGARTLEECLRSLTRLQYPNYEVIVVNDGSTDGTPEIIELFPFRAVHQPNRGLSAARNAGFGAASGEIVAYIDDDAYADPTWLTYLALTFLGSDHAGVGGPNLVPPHDPFVAQCVGHSPGGPTHVLLTDDVAEHIPGCNMAFRKSDLAAIGGFDAQFRIAGDDVDVCWRLQAQGRTLGFSPAAVVWHHRRNSVSRYLKQQRGYGRAEAALTQLWPEKYNAAGHATWAGRIYGTGVPEDFLLGPARIYQGVWGSAPFQTRLSDPPSRLQLWAAMPEWNLWLAALCLLTLLSAAWPRLFWAAGPLLAGALALTLWNALSAARAVWSGHRFPSRREALRALGLTTALHLAQPVARLWGRLEGGVGPFLSKRRFSFALPRPKKLSRTDPETKPVEERLAALRAELVEAGATVECGGEFDRWDLCARRGLFGAVRVRLATEEHRTGQVLRFFCWPAHLGRGLTLTLAAAALAGAAAADGAYLAAFAFAAAALAFASQTVRAAGAAQSAVLSAIQRIGNGQLN